MDQTHKNALAAWADLEKQRKEQIAQLRLAVEAGLKAFEFLGERMNANDGAADESQANLDKVAEWAGLINACIPEDRRRELAEEVWAMLDKDSDSDGD